MAKPAVAPAHGPLIAARDLSVVRNGRTILDRVSLQVAEGEILTVVGPNGAGKTTLLKALLLLIPPSAGRIDRRPGLRVGYLPQRLSVDTVLPMTVSRLLTLTCRRTRGEVAAALEETSVSHLIDTVVQTLSGGEARRVLLARALLRDPDLLVLDEPLQGVDFSSEAALYRMIGDIRDTRGCAVLMVSHDLHLVMAATDRVICLNRHVCCAGPVETITVHPEYLKLLGPRAAEALAVYPHHHDHVHTPSGTIVPMDTSEGAGDEESRQPLHRHD